MPARQFPSIGRDMRQPAKLLRIDRGRLLLMATALATAALPARTLEAQVLTGAPLPVMTAPPPSAELPRSYDSAELERILSPIALYPDPLLAQVLTATTFPSEIPAAMQWLDARRGRDARQLAELLAAERVPWDPSVQSLIAFPTVLQMMATSMPWTAEVGDAFIRQRGDVMDAVQRLREQAHRYGYLQNTPQVRVVHSPAIEILPVDPAYVVVPYYNPVVVFAPPRPRFVTSTAIHFGFGVHLGLWYEPWGWRRSGFYWPTRHIIGGYPGWRHYNHSTIVVRKGYDDDRSRYSPRAVYVNDRGYDRRDGRYDGRYDSRPDHRERVAVPRGDRNGRDDRNVRDGRDERRTAPVQPRTAQPRESRPSGQGESQRSVTRSASSEQRSGGQQGSGGYRRR